MKKTMKRSLLLVIVIALFATIALTASAAEAYNLGTSIGETTFTSLEGHIGLSLKPATVDADGEYTYTCVHCNVAIESGVIPKIDSKSIKLSTSEYVYNGEAKKPSLEIKDVKGKVLVKDKDYKVEYASGRKNPGKYTVTVTFMGNYEGTTKLEFKILPKAVSGLKSTAQTTTSITLDWSKVTGATGYEVYKYNSSSKKYEKIKELTDLSYKATGLKEGTTYKFKVRAYTKAADGTNIYGAYSSVYSVKTKVPYNVTISGTSATIYVGGTKQLKATTNPANKTVTWKSSDSSIAKVSSSGKVTAVKKGTATITVSFKYKDTTYKDTYKITVKNPSLKLNCTSFTMIVGKSSTLKATTEPADLKVTWKSSNTAIATVSAAGKVTAKKTGSVTITASFAYKGKTYSKTCNIKVIAKPTKFGDVTGNVTYFYNNYRGNVPDTGAMVILIPRNGQALALETTSSISWFTSPTSTWNEEYGIYGAKVDGTGQYYISGVPAGDYAMFIISEETTDGTWFRDKDYYKSIIKSCAKHNLSESSSESLADAISYNKYEWRLITIKDGITTHASHDFGITYI